MKGFTGIFPGLIAVMMVFGVAAFAEGVFAQERGQQQHREEHRQEKDQQEQQQRGGLTGISRGIRKRRTFTRRMTVG